MEELGLESIPPPPGLPPPTYIRPDIRRGRILPPSSAPQEPAPGSKYSYRPPSSEPKPAKPVLENPTVPPRSQKFRLPSQWFRNKSNLEKYEESLANILKDHRLAKISADEELHKDLATRSLRLQRIQTKHAEGLLKLRIDHERNVNKVVHEHRMHVAEKELDLQRKTRDLDDRLQLDLRRIERAQMKSKWRMVIDPKTGHAYYVDDETGESRWTRPKDGSGAVLAEAKVDGMEEIRDDCKCTICLDFFEGHAIQVGLNLFPRVRTESLIFFSVILCAGTFSFYLVRFHVQTFN
jgi:hypothetical protein